MAQASGSQKKGIWLCESLRAMMELEIFIINLNGFSHLGDRLPGVTLSAFTLSVGWQCLALFTRWF